MSARKCCTINGAQSSFPRLLRKLSREDFEDEDDAFQVKRMMIERRDDGAFAFADGNRTRATTSTMSSSSFFSVFVFSQKVRENGLLLLLLGNPTHLQ